MTISSQQKLMKMDNTTRAIEQELGCSKSNPDEEEFDVFKTISETLLRKTIIINISTRLLGLDFNSDNKLKSKAMNFIVIKILPGYM